MTGTTIIVPQYYTSIDEQSAVRLARYAQLVGYDENPFWGINHNVGDNTCRYIWTLSQRLMAAKYLREAQGEIEEVLSYKIGYQWVEEIKQRLRFPMLTRYGYVVAFGIMGLALVSAGEAVDHSTDPVTIGPLATTVVDPGEIAIFHPGTQIEITPGSVVISGGNVTITIPKCRMVTAAYADNPATGWNYADYDTWGEQSVDVARRYNDASTQAILSKNHRCNTVCMESGCSEYTQTACVFVKKPGIGSIEIYPADYADGVWTKHLSYLCCNDYDLVKLYYLSGVPMTYQMEDMIMRLAHAKMPAEPCGCDPIKSLWERDTHLPEVYSRERINCRFGMSDGAWQSWEWAHDLRLLRGGIVS